MEHEVFPNAPITEAILDIRANLPSTVDLAALATFQGGLQERYPTRVERVVMQGGMKLAEAGAQITHAIKGTLGYQFSSEDGKKVVQARLDGFSHHKLKPYDKWESFFAEANELWERYRTIANPINVTRIAIRYINRIEIPMPITDLKDYLLTCPEIATGAPQAMASFFMRLVLAKEDSDAVAIVTETTAPPPPDLRVMPIILDIDVYLERVFDPTDGAIWTQLESLRQFRNEVFFNSITPKTRELFV